MIQKMCMLLAISFLACNCSYFQNHYRYGKQAEYHLAQKEYRKAVEKSVKSLERNNQNQTSIQVLKDSYDGMVTVFDNSIEKMPNQTTADKENRATSYKQMVAINNKIRKIERNGPDLGLTLVNYSEIAQKARIGANTAKYNDGLKLLDSDNRSDHIAAAQIFKKLVDFKDAPEQYNKARSLATYSYVFIPFQDQSSQKKSLQLGNLISLKLQKALLLDNHFKEFNAISSVPAWSANSGAAPLTHQTVGDYIKKFNTSADLAVFGYIEQVNLLPPTLTQRVDEHRKNIKLSSSTDGNKKVKKSREVKGEATHFERTLLTEVVLQISIVDLASGTVINDQKVTGVYSYIDRWARFKSGDRRAVEKLSNYLASNEAIPALPAPEARIAYGVDELVKNTGSLFGSNITTVPQVNLTRISTKPQDPTGAKIGLDKKKLLKKLGGGN